MTEIGSRRFPRALPWAEELCPFGAEARCRLKACASSAQGIALGSFHAISSPRIVPLPVENSRVSVPRRCNIDTNRFVSG